MESSDYELDPTHPSGPMFQLKYNAGIQFNSCIPKRNDMRPPAFTIYHQVTITNIDNNKKIATVMDISLNNSIFNDDTVHQVSQEYITNINPSHLITTSNNHIYDNFPWLKNDSNIKVLFPKEMQSKTRLSISK